MSNLKPLVWSNRNKAKSPFRLYQVRIAMGGESFDVHYEGSQGEPATGFCSIEDAKEWAEFTHYKSEMNRYVNLAASVPVWIDAKTRLPQVDEDTQFICAYDSAIEPFVKVAFFNADIGQFNYQHDSVLAWMPMPDFVIGGDK